MSTLVEGIRSRKAVARLYHAYSELYQEALKRGDEEVAAGLAQLWDVIANRIDEIPVVWSPDNKMTQCKSHTMYFVLGPEGWVPCSAGIERDEGLYEDSPVLNYRISYVDGSSESGVEFFGGWAHCTADQTPYLPMRIGGHE